VGAVEVLPLLDGVALAGRPAVESFPGGRPETWEDARRRHPGAFAEDRWRLHVRCFLLRSEGQTILVDAGLGPEGAPAFAWSGVAGSLPVALEDAGVAPGEVDLVVVTHVHDDHLGWTTVEETGRPRFDRAPHLVHPADWELMASTDDPEDREIFRATLEPIERAGLLRLSGDRVDLTTEVAVVHAPGHTPGHQVVLVDSGGRRAIVSGDLVNHPVQLLQPGVNGASDMEPARAAETRAAFLERIEREARLVFPAHFPAPAGHVVREGETWDWRAAERDDPSLD
jgi:glyoxylase-like metal-dependent hydrolase (beta-lactamase superfamily II)